MVFDHTEGIFGGRFRSRIIPNRRRKRIGHDSQVLFVDHEGSRENVSRGSRRRLDATNKAPRIPNAIPKEEEGSRSEPRSNASASVSTRDVARTWKGARVHSSFSADRAFHVQAYARTAPAIDVKLIQIVGSWAPPPRGGGRTSTSPTIEIFVQRSRCIARDVDRIGRDVDGPSGGGVSPRRCTWRSGYRCEGSIGWAKTRCVSRRGQIRGLPRGFRTVGSSGSR